MEKLRNILTMSERLYTKVIRDEDWNNLMQLYIHDSYDDFDSIRTAFNKDGRINERRLKDIIKSRIDGYKTIKLSSKNKFSRVLVYKKDTDECVGMVGFDTMDVENLATPLPGNVNQYDVSKNAIVLIYKIHPFHCNKGYATEVIKSMLQWFFEKLTHKQILANIYKTNYPSIRVVEKLGFEKLYEYQCNTNGSYNADCFGLKKENLIAR
jgi:hypothetical protein